MLDKLMRAKLAAYSQINPGEKPVWYIPSDMQDYLQKRTGRAIPYGSELMGLQVYMADAIGIPAPNTAIIKLHTSNFDLSILLCGMIVMDFFEGIKSPL